MKLRNIINQKGFAHLGLILIVVALVGVVSFSAYRINHRHNTNKAASSSTSATTSRKKAVNQPTVAAATPLSPSTSTTTTSASTKPTSSSSTTSSTSTAPASSQTSSGASSTQSQSCTAPGLKFLTALGCIPAATLYNVKSPPASNQQPNMNIYACIQYVDSSTAYVEVLGTLSYSVNSSPTWYVDLDLSSTASSDSVISSKTTTYSYYNNAWQVGSSTLQQTSIKSENFNPGVVNDYYIWAFGSYGNTVLAGINNHPNVKNLQSCS